MELVSIDTETTGLHFQHGCEAFAIGIHNGSTGYYSEEVGINPLTRKKDRGFNKETVEVVQEAIKDKVVVFQNANFDLKALCTEGIVDWEEPRYESFWENIVELGHLSHLHDSRDSGKDSSLKILTPKYLDRDYLSEAKLDALVTRCRNFVRTRNTDWKIASFKNCPYEKPTSKWVKQDMWLPAAVFKAFSIDELLEYFAEDTNELTTVVSKYLRDDCENTYNLGAGFAEALEGQEEFLQMNRQISHVLWKIESDGIRVSTPEITKGIAVCKSLIEESKSRCYDLAEREKGSKLTDATLREILFDHFELTPVDKTKTGLDRVNADSLIKLKEQVIEGPASEFLSNLLAYRKIEKKQQYLEGYERLACKKTQKLYPKLHATGTGTTRFTSTDPNGQQIEKGGNPFENSFHDVAIILEKAPKLRASFCPPENKWWIAADYSQLQLRIFAAATKEESMIEAFRQGYDFHTFMAKVIFDLGDNQEPTKDQRRIAKNVNFGFIFGASEKKIDKTAQRAGLYSYLMSSFPNAHEFLRETREKIKETGVVHTLGGYPLHIPTRINPWDGQPSYAAHMGVNYIVQGTEGEIVKRAMRSTDDYLVETYPEGRLLFQVHDEILFETPEFPPKVHVANLCGAMEEAGSYYGVETPVDAEVHMSSFSKKTEIIL